MEESEKRCAKLEDVQVEDFIRFVEYAYRGDYTVPPWEDVLPRPSSPVGEDQKNGFNDDLNSANSPAKVEAEDTQDQVTSEQPPPTYAETTEEVLKDESCIQVVSEPMLDLNSISGTPLRTPLWTRFNNRNYLINVEPRTQILNSFEPKHNTTANQNFTPVFLAHARLYCFAHYRMIAPLKALTLDKLHKTLLNFKLYEKRVGDVIELARHAYSHPDIPNRSADGTIDELRKLIVEYIVCEVDTIGKHEDFVEYMKEGGEFVEDFWRLARDYMA